MAGSKVARCVLSPATRRLTGAPPLVPFSGEFYQAGVGIAGVEALAALARAIGKNDVAQQLDHEAAPSARPSKNSSGRPTNNFYAFAARHRRQSHRQAQRARHCADVVRPHRPAQERSLPQHHRRARPPGRLGHAHHLATRTRCTRPPAITSAACGRSSPDGPRSPDTATTARSTAMLNLMANAQLAHDGSPGRTTEVLSGDFYTAALHQHAAPDLVIGHGDQPDLARHDGAGSERADIRVILRAACSRRMERLRHPQCARWEPRSSTSCTTVWERTSPSKCIATAAAMCNSNFRRP